MNKSYLILLIFILLEISASAQKNKINPNGYNKFFYENGKISSEGNFTNGKPTGLWKSYYPSGILKTEGTRKNDKLDSLWKFYDETGNITQAINYRAGLRNGFYYTYKFNEKTAKNELFSKALFLNDDKFGKTYYYYPDNKIKSVIDYENNRKHGREIHYDTVGRITLIMKYNHDNLTHSEQINRHNHKGEKQGVWKSFYPDGSTKKFESYKNGKLHGYYREFNAKGKMINSKLYAEGKEVVIPKEEKEKHSYAKIKEELYPNGKLKKQGAFQNNKPIGYHNEFDKNGKIIATKLYSKKGILKGKGIADKKSKKQGNWTFYYKTGEKKSEGKYKNGRKIGTWTYFFKGQKIEQKGTFVKGRPSGNWVWYYPNGKIRRTGNFAKGKENGKFIEYALTGDTIAIGKYLAGKKEGEWLYKVNGFVKKGTYTIGLKSGLWKHFYPDNTMEFEGTYMNGEEDGEHIYYYPSGRKKEIQIYTSGVKSKTWKKYLPDGNLETVTMYKNNQKYKIDGHKVEQ